MALPFHKCISMSDQFSSPTVDAAKSVPVEPIQFVQFPAIEPPASLKKLIDDWQLIKHREGGYFKETDRSPFFMDVCDDEEQASGGDVTCAFGEKAKPDENTLTVKRNYSTLIYYLLTPDAPVGKLHKNKNRIIHILQKGKGQYVLIYPDGTIKSFKVGFDYANGEVAQWVVPGGVYKASFLLPNEEFDNGLLISEVVVPGFEYADHKFMTGEKELVELVGEEKAQSLEFLL